MLYDVFISYRHARKDEVIAFCRLLEEASITFFRDEERRDDNVLIQAGIETGLENSKLMLAWFDPSYLESRACTWELGRALMAARCKGATFKRALEKIVCIDPTGTFQHIPEELWDRARAFDGGDPGACIAHVRDRLSSGAAEPFGQVPAELNDNWYERECPRHPTWVGRESELIRAFAQLSRGEIAMKGDDRAPVAITGHGGEGKTMLAEQYAIRHASAYPGGVVWLKGPSTDGSDPSDEWLRQLERELEQISSGPKLNIPLEATEQALKGITDPRLRVRLLKRQIEDRLTTDAGIPGQVETHPYLWVVDDMPQLTGEDTLLWLPNGSHVHCLVTARGANTSAIFREIKLPLLARSQALKILTRVLTPSTDAEERAAHSIVDMLGRLPLALELAAAAVDTYEALLNVLRQPLDEGLELLFDELGGVLPTKHASSILKTFDRSLDRLDGSDAASTHSTGAATWTLLRATALSYPVPLPDVLALNIFQEMGFPTAWFQIALSRGRSAAVLRRPGPAEHPCSELHSLLARTVAETRITSAQKSDLLDALVRAIERWLKGETTKERICVDLGIFSVATPLLRMNFSIESGRVCYELGNFAFELGRLIDALQLQQHSLAIRQRILGEKNPSTVDAMEAVALTLMGQGDVIQAKFRLEGVVSCRLASNASNDRLTLRVISHLAVALHMLGDFEAAKERHEWVWQCWQQIDGLAAEALGAASNLALTLEAMGDDLRASQLHRTVFASRRLAFGDDDLDTLDSLQHLALFDLRRGDLRSAEVSFRTLRAAHGRRAGIRSPEALSACHNLAITWRLRGKFRAACVLLKQTVERMVQILGASHPATLSAKHEWAEVWIARGEPGYATDLLESLVDLRRRDLGNENANTQNSMAALGRAYFADGRLTRARSIQEFLLLSKLSKNSDDDSIDFQETVIQLQQTVRAQGDQKRLEELNFGGASSTHKP